MAVNALFRVKRLADERMVLVDHNRKALSGGLNDGLGQLQRELLA